MPLLQGDVTARGPLRLKALLVAAALAAAGCSGSDTAEPADEPSSVPATALEADGNAELGSVTATVPGSAPTAQPVAGSALTEPGPATVRWWLDEPCAVESPCLPPDPGVVVPDVVVVAPAAGGVCPEGATCDLQATVDAVAPGAVVEVRGAHPSITIERSSISLVGSRTCCASIESARIDGAAVTLRGLATGTVVLGPAADDAVIVYARTGTVFVNGADRVRILGNVMRPPSPGPDVIQVKEFDGDEPTDLWIEGNVIGPQPSADDSHTDCIQVLGGDRITVARNVILPCGDKAMQLRSGAGGELGAVVVEGNVILECRERRPGCAGFHAIIWASTERSSLELRHNTIRGSVGLSSSGSTTDPGDNFVAVGNIVAAMPCTNRVVDNLTVTAAACGAGGVMAPFPVFRDDAEQVGDLRPVDPTTVPRASAPFGPDLLGAPLCPQPAFGAFTDCG